jgi:hypothetical protein
MMGGAGIIASFLDWSRDRRAVPLKLLSCSKFTNGVVKLRYACRK